MLNKLLMMMTVAAAWCVALPGQAQGLVGSTVTGGVYCCQAPTDANLITNLVTATVGAQVEFPASAFQSTNGEQLTSETIDVAANSIDIVYNEANTTADGAFNGYVLDFTGAPGIASVSVNPLSTLSPTSLSWDADSVFINVASQTLPLDSRLLLNVLAVPEPATGAMLLAGMVLLGLSRRQRGKSSGRPDRLNVS